MIDPSHLAAQWRRMAAHAAARGDDARAAECRAKAELVDYHAKHPPPPDLVSVVVAVKSAARLKAMLSDLIPVAELEALWSAARAEARDKRDPWLLGRRMKERLEATRA